MNLGSVEMNSDIALKASSNAMHDCQVKHVQLFLF